ncbi:hypothetical protein ACFVX6_33210 [Streptomyces sp. NPDC058289]
MKASKTTYKPVGLQHDATSGMISDAPPQGGVGLALTTGADRPV